MDQAQGEKTEGSRRDQGAVSRGAGGFAPGEAARLRRPADSRRPSVTETPREAGVLESGSGGVIFDVPQQASAGTMSQSSQRSERSHGFRHVRDLVRRRRPAENLVAMRKATKSVNDHLVRHGGACPVLVAQSSDQIKRKRLILGVLAMLERKVKKKPLLFCHREGGPGTCCARTGPVQSRPRGSTVARSRRGR